jgi:Mrp family chromosome partitioning ATPase/capsular polysaccharide biosynthesis protein
VDQNSRDIDLKQVIATLRERWWIVVVCAALAAAVAFAYSYTREPLFRATASIMRESANLDQALFGARVFDSSNQERALRTGAALVKTNTVATMVQSELGSPRSPGQLLGMVSVTPSAVTDMISITAVSPNPQEAAQVANTFAEQFILARQAADRTTLSVAREKIAAELGVMTDEQLASDRGRTLVQKYEELGILESMQTGGYALVQTAAVPPSAFSPRLVWNTGIAGVAGLAAGLILAFVLQFLDRRIKDEDVLEATVGAPVLARIPRVGSQWKRRKHGSGEGIVGFAEPGTPLLEAFRSLRSNLQFFEVDKPLKTIMITSALPREGKSITTVNLALSLALSGSRVFIIEADLRRPRLHTYLGVDPAPGLSTCLAGAAQLTAVTQAIQSTRFFPPSAQAFPADDATRNNMSAANHLACISSGPLPPNPAELLGSSQMTALLADLSGVADYVIVDVPPVLAVSDALILAPHMDAVLITARLYSTTYDAAREMRSLLTRAGARVIGVVVQDVPRPRGYYQRYGEYTRTV